MFKKLNAWLAQLWCNHVSVQLIRWHWTHGINGNDPRTVEAEYRCDKCGKLVYMHLNRKESFEWVWVIEFERIIEVVE